MEPNPRWRVLPEAGPESAVERKDAMRALTILGFLVVLGLAACGDTVEERAASGGLIGGAAGLAVGAPIAGAAVGAGTGAVTN